MTEFWFGDIAVGLITDKDTDISKEVVEKNFVDKPVQVYELTPNLEAGNYSVILLEKTHPRTESLKEQRDAILSMPDKHVSEFPFNYGGDKGHVLVESSSVSITPSQMIDEGELNIRFLEDDDYKPVIDAKAEFNSSNFTPTASNENNTSPESVLPIPSYSENILKNGISVSPEFTLGTDQGDLEFYLYGNERTRFEYDLADETYTLPERVAPVRVYDAIRDGSGSYGENYGNDYGSLGEAKKVRRVYSDMFSFKGSAIIDNRKIISFPDEDKSEIYAYDNSDVYLIAETNLTPEFPGYISENGNYKNTIEFIDGITTTVYRGFPVVHYSFTDEGRFKYKTDLGLYDGSDGDYYYTAKDGNDNTVVVIRNSNDGEFVENHHDDFSEIIWESINPNEEYEVFSGIVPSSVDVDDFTRWIYNIGDVNRKMKQR